MYLCTLLILWGAKCAHSELSGGDGGGNGGDAPTNEELERLNGAVDEKRSDYVCLNELLRKYALLKDPDERIARLMREQLKDTNSSLEALRTQIEQIKAAAASSTMDKLYKLFDTLKEKRKDYACRYEIYAQYKRIENPDKRVLELMSTQIRSVDSNIKELIGEAEKKKKDLERTGITIQSDILEEFIEFTETSSTTTRTTARTTTTTTTPPVVRLDEEEVDKRARDMVNKYRREGNFITKDRMYDLYMNARDVVKAGGSVLEPADRQIAQLDRELARDVVKAGGSVLKPADRQITQLDRELAVIPPRECGFDVFVRESEETDKSDTGSFRTFRRKIEQRGSDIYLGPTDMEKRPADEEDTAHLTSTGDNVEEQLTLGPFSTVITPDWQTYIEKIGLNELKRDLAINSSRSFNAMFRELLDEGAAALKTRKPDPTPIANTAATSSRGGGGGGGGGGFSLSDGHMFRVLSDKVKSQLLGMNSDFGESDRSAATKATTKSILSKVRVARTRQSTQSRSTEVVLPGTTEEIGFGALRDRFKVFLTSSRQAAKPVETETLSSFTIHEVGFDDLRDKFKVSFYSAAPPPSVKEKPRARVIPTERSIVEYDSDPDDLEDSLSPPLPPSPWRRLTAKAPQKQVGEYGFDHPNDPKYSPPSERLGSLRAEIPQLGVASERNFNSDKTTETLRLVTNTVTVATGSYGRNLGPSEVSLENPSRSYGNIKDPIWKRLKEELQDTKDKCLRKENDLDLCLLDERPDGVKAALLAEDLDGLKRKLNNLEREIGERERLFDQSTKKTAQQEGSKRELNHFEKEIYEREEPVVVRSTKKIVEPESRERQPNGFEKRIGQRDGVIVVRSTKRSLVHEKVDEVMQRYHTELQKMKEEYVRQDNAIKQYLKCKNPNENKVQSMEQDLRNLRKYVSHLEGQIGDREVWLADKGWASVMKTPEISKL